MKKLLLLLIFCFPLLAQPPAQQPDCWFPVTLIAATSTVAFDNSTASCNSWVFDYTNTGFSVLSIVVQTAPTSGTGPGAWSTFAPVTGINPNTSITHALSTFGVSTNYFPFLRVTLTSATGAGVIQGTLYGWRIPASGSGGGSGCVGTAGVPCIVAGPDASGAVPTQSPVQVAGFDGTDIRTIRTDATGDAQVAVVGNAAVLSGQQAVTGAAVALATHTIKNVCIKALLANTINVYVGPTGITTATGMELAPGDAVCLPVLNTNLLFVIASTVGNSVSWVATN